MNIDGHKIDSMCTAKPEVESLSAKVKCSKKPKGRRKSKCYRDGNKLEHENKKLRNITNISKNIIVCIIESKKMSNSPKIQLNRQLKEDNECVLPKNRRQLLFGKAMTADIKSIHYAGKSKNDFRSCQGNLKLKYVKKYRFRSIAKPILPVRAMYNLKRSYGENK